VIRINLLNLDNQTVKHSNDDVNYTLKIYDGDHGRLVDIAIDGEPIISGQRLVTQYPLIPYQYLEVGNFIILSEFDSLENAELMYLSVEELKNARQTA